MLSGQLFVADVNAARVAKVAFTLSDLCLSEFNLRAILPRVLQGLRMICLSVRQCDIVRFRVNVK